jgi:hypothetical protein
LDTCAQHRVSQGFHHFIPAFSPIELLQNFSQRFSVLLPHLVQHIPHGVEDTKAHATSGKDLLVASSNPEKIIGE